MTHVLLFCLGIFGIAVFWDLVPGLPTLLKMICSGCCGALWANYYLEWMS